MVNSPDVPSAREGHTATVAGSKMVVFGGRGVNLTAGPVLLGEQWEIDLDVSRTVVVQTNASTVRNAGLIDSSCADARTLRAPHIPEYLANLAHDR